MLFFICLFQLFPEWCRFLRPKQGRSTEQDLRRSQKYVIALRILSLQLTQTLNLASNEDDKDTLGAESTMNYLQTLGANLEDASFFIILEIVRAPSIGEISREGFVEGWKDTGYVLSYQKSIHLSVHRPRFFPRI